MENKWEVGQWYRSNVAADLKRYRYIGSKSDGSAVFECPEFDIDGVVIVDCYGYPRGKIDGFQITTEKVKQKLTVQGWVNVYKNGGWSNLYKEREYADRDPMERIACKHISFEIQEGEGI